MFADRMTPSRRVALATACGKQKRHGEWPMHLLLSAEYGLVHCDEVRASYDRRMDSERAEKLAPLVAEVMRRYDWLVFFNAQTPLEYARCLERGSDICGVPVAFIGWWPLGGLDECILVAQQLSRGETADSGMRSLRLYGASHD